MIWAWLRDMAVPAVPAKHLQSPEGCRCYTHWGTAAASEASAYGHELAQVTGLWVQAQVQPRMAYSDLAAEGWLGVVGRVACATELIVARRGSDI